MPPDAAAVTADEQMPDKRWPSLPARTFVRARAALTFGGGYPLLIVLAGLMDARRTIALAFGLDRTAWEALSAGVDYLLIAEWLTIFALVRASDWRGIKTLRFEPMLALIPVAYGLCGVIAISHWMTIVVCYALAARLAWQPGMRRLPAALIIVASQYLAHAAILKPIGEACARLDAWVTHALLSAAGFANELSGTILRVGQSTFAIDVLAGCSTFLLLPPVLAAFLIFAIAARADIGAIAKGTLFVVIACALLNALRLALMAQSAEAHHFWHYGTGVSVVSFVVTSVAYVVAHHTTVTAPLDDAGADKAAASVMVCSKP